MADEQVIINEDGTITPSSVSISTQDNSIYKLEDDLSATLVVMKDGVTLTPKITIDPFRMKTESLKRGRETGKKEPVNQIEKKKVLTEAVEILASKK